MSILLWLIKKLALPALLIGCVVMLWPQIKDAWKKVKIMFGFCLIVLLLIGCVDKSSAIMTCDAKNLSFYAISKPSCDIICMNINTGEKHTFDGYCKTSIEFNGG